MPGWLWILPVIFVPVIRAGVPAKTARPRQINFLKNNHLLDDHLSDMFVYAADDLSFHDGEFVLDYGRFYLDKKFLVFDVYLLGTFGDIRAYDLRPSSYYGRYIKFLAQAIGV